MTDKEPTKEQIKEFWEWCGLRYTKPYWVDAQDKIAFYGEAYSELLRSIDLNNLFKYAVPKLRELKYYIVLRDISKGFHCSLVYTTAEKRSWYGEANDPALALFWAIWEVIKK